MNKCNFNKEISLHPVYRVGYRNLIEARDITCVYDYDHYALELHHYILFQSYSRHENWYKERQIGQKLILLPKDIHRFLHTTSDRFNYKGFKWYELLFSKKHSNY